MIRQICRARYVRPLDHFPGSRTLHTHSKISRKDSEKEDMEVTIASEELIQPSTPTPDHLQRFKLSLLNQLCPFAHAPVILFYPNSNAGLNPTLDLRRKLDILKKSLSRTLTRFYPLAGKIAADGLHVECDDEGARFIEARVNTSLPRFLADPDLVLLNKLIPCEFVFDDLDELARAANIQVNVFECGGIAVAICNTHKLHDGIALGAFLNEWTAFSRAGTAPAGCELLAGSAGLFPTDDPRVRDLVRTTYISMTRRGNCVTRRFLFSGPAIEALRARGKGPGMANPTRVEAVSGFLWKCAIAAFARKNNGLGRPSTFSHVVDIRKRMDFPLPEYSIGNLVLLSTAHSGSRPADDDDVLPSLVGRLRRAIRNVDGDFLSSLSRDGSLIYKSKGFSADADHITCSSWTRFGFYEVDFGWGRPIWVSNVGMHGSVVLNFIFLVGTRSGDGIEAWVTLDEHDISMLQEDPELRSFASVDPSPLMMNSMF